MGRQISSKPVKLPERRTFLGRYVILEPLDVEKHHRSLYENYRRTPSITDFMIEPEITTL